jgi:MFS family permease
MVASFMPFYDVFVTARFFSAVGMGKDFVHLPETQWKLFDFPGGVLPTAISYISEVTPSSSRARFLGMLGALGISGGLLFAGLGTLIVPLSGKEIMLEGNSEVWFWGYLLLIRWAD